ncbi:AraC family transcriptional regulator [Microbacterium sp. 18062]|uniref:helix-turn-helix transcriptional regulator n=1 Tax=Microbacterium sp. 18062 TaxID=2681410 RepID=UPI001356BAE9|nr:AraC family transcriptional regulator [Microbacterium sp. 18062]
MVESLRAWHPDVPVVQEVLHATFEHHAYPAHTHDSWAVLVIDEGAVAYDLDRTAHRATPATVTLLPPHVPHDGRSATPGVRFRKRVLYLDAAWLPSRAAGAAVASPTLRDPRATTAVDRVHSALASPADVLEAEHGILLLHGLAKAHLGEPAAPTTGDAPLARRLRRLLDERLTETFTLADAARILGSHPSRLMRVFSEAYGIPPHRYVTGRRIDRARRLLLDGRAPARVAAETGFYDQPHLTRHFRKVLGTTPALFAAAARGDGGRA